MKVQALAGAVDRIIANVGDFEVQHGDEDDLMQAYIRAHAPADVLAEFERLWAADFPRYCA